MIAGTTKQRECYPVHTITQHLPTPITDNILRFHALKGCDTTSSFTGFGKRKCWKVFEEFPTLIRGLGRDGPKDEIEEFVCRLYRAQIVVNIDAELTYLKKGIETSSCHPHKTR